MLYSKPGFSVYKFRCFWHTLLRSKAYKTINNVVNLITKDTLLGLDELFRKNKLNKCVRFLQSTVFISDFQEIMHLKKTVYIIAYVHRSGLSGQGRTDCFYHVPNRLHFHDCILLRLSWCFGLLGCNATHASCLAGCAALAVAPTP